MDTAVASSSSFGSPVDIGGAINAVMNGLKGGTVGAIATGVVIILLVIFIFVYKAQIKKLEQELAQKQTQINNNQAHQGAVGQSESQESGINQAQIELGKVEIAALVKLLDSLSDVDLVAKAVKAFGVDAVWVALGLASADSLAYPLVDKQRLIIYKLYGVV